jgi:hypothetical protein
MEEDVPHRPGKLYKLKNQLKSNGKNLRLKTQKLAV